MIENGTFQVRTHAGLEPVLQQELTEAGAQHLFISEGSIRFKADEAALYRFLLRTFVTTSVELLLSRPVDIRQTHLPALAALVDWPEVIPIHSVIEVRAYHNGQTSGKLRVLADELTREICGIYASKFDQTPKIADEDETPEFVVLMHVEDNGSCYLALEAGGEPFAKRSRMSIKDGAVITPALAAGLIKLSGWDKESRFIDPFANNGALLIEAARIAKNRTPCFEDDAFLMKKWRTFRHAFWKKQREALVEEIRKDVDWIYGSDYNMRTFGQLKFIIRNLRLTENIRIKQSKAAELFIPEGGGIIITAPPPELDLKIFGEFAKRIRQFGAGYTLAVFTPHHNLDAVVGMKARKTLKIMFDEREFSFMIFDIFGKDKRKSRPVEHRRDKRTPSRFAPSRKRGKQNR